MTSSSRRKRQTTRPNTRRRSRTEWWRRISSALLALGCATSLGLAADDSPLDRLRSRSAENRWAAARAQTQPRPASAAQAPARPGLVAVPLPAPPAGSSPRTVSQAMAQREAAYLPPPAPPVEGPVLPLAPGLSATQAEDPGAAPLLPPSRPVPPPTPELLPLPDRGPDPREPVTLKRVTEIQPFYDYEPDADLRRTDPYRNLCPRPMAALDANALQCPDIRSLPGADQIYSPPAVPPSVYTWAAPDLWYYPLYFEDFDLERYGHTYPWFLQPFDSVGKFTVQLVGLPYQMTFHPTWQHVFPLGYYRPGEHAPKLFYQIPYNTKAAINQAAVTTGLILLIP